MKNNKFKSNNNRSNIQVSEFSITRQTISDNLILKPDWVKVLNQNPIHYIIKKGNPAEVFLLLKNVYKLTHSHALYRLVESAVFKQKALHKIANKN